MPMIQKIMTCATIAALLCGLPAPTRADDPSASEIAVMRAEMEALRAEVAELRRDESDNWLNEQRAEQIKDLIREVLADAETRATLIGDGVYAGNKDGKFFLASGDGSFLMEFGGQIQLRYVYNEPGDAGSFGSSSSDDSGFSLRRVKFKVKGHVFDNFIYQVSFQGDTDSSDNGFDIDVSYLGYKFDGVFDGLMVRGGYLKLPFMFEELTSSSRQLAVERSSFNEFFTTDKAIGVELGYKQDVYIARVMFSNQPGSDFVSGDFTGEDGHFAGATRIDVKLLGDWKQAKDFSAWSGKDPYLQVGGAFAWADETEDFSRTLAFTTDVLYKVGLLSLYGAFAYADVADPALLGSPIVGSNPWGFMVQGGYFVIPDTLQPFLRFEHIDGDTSDDAFDLLTAGVNYYLHKHKAKFTLDTIVSLSDATAAPGDKGIWGEESPFGTGLGMNGYTGTHMVTVRAQFQLLF